MRLTLVFLLTFLFVGQIRSGAAPSPVTEKELKAYMPWDLGPDTVDVSKYPPNQQENYRVFQKNCSVCHTPARPINATLTSYEDWTRFINLMHARFKSRMKGPLWSTRDAAKIRDFLTYDSQVRKIDHREEFEKLQRELNQRFEEVQKEKAELAKHQKAQPSAPYTGANP
jgi:hypothetical protein